MKHLKVLALAFCINANFAQAQVQKWENWQNNLVIYDGNYRSLPTQRNLGLHLWHDGAFGMELHFRDGNAGTALFTRDNNEPIWFGNYSSNITEQRLFNPRMTLVNGKLGIGTTTPDRALSVSGTDEELGKFVNPNTVNTRIVIQNPNAIVCAGIGAVTKHGYLWSNTGTVFFGDDGAPTMSIIGMNNGNVGIGTEDTRGYKLAVNGSVICEKVVVKLKVNWPDYVFDPIYKLPSLTDVESYLKQNHHLPEVPSAETIKKDGINLGENQAVLLKKIEELTLYVIEQNKKLHEQNAKMELLEKKLIELTDKNK